MEFSSRRSASFINLGMETNRDVAGLAAPNRSAARPDHPRSTARPRSHRMTEPATLFALAVSTATADEAQNEFVRNVLRSQRRRLAAVLRSLNDDEWTVQSRCTEWSVHEVVRHLCDATFKCTELLRGELPEGSEQFDPRTTPVAWLARSANERPRDTIAVFEDASAELLDEVDRHFRDATNARLPFLYGPVPWSIVVLHVFWDAWVHERDILLPVRRPHDSPAVESRAVAAYGLTACCVPVMLEGTQLNESVVLAGDGGGMFRLETHDGKITTTVGDGDRDVSNAQPVCGALDEVVDSLVGRGPELTEVLRGPPERIHRLGMLRAFMLLPAS
jgi:uncharacterized protein (TIGR03083 family)